MKSPEHPHELLGVADLNEKENEIGETWSANVMKNWHPPNKNSTATGVAGLNEKEIEIGVSQGKGGGSKNHPNEKEKHER